MQRHWRKIVNGCALWIAACVIALAASIPLAFAYDYPPEEYKRPPTMPVVVTVVPASQVATVCAHVIRVETRDACQQMAFGSCHIFIREMSTDFRWGPYQRLLEHELAHCNGWTHPVRGNRVYPTEARLDPRERAE